MTRLHAPRSKPLHRSTVLGLLGAVAVLAIVVVSTTAATMPAGASGPALADPHSATGLPAQACNGRCLNPHPGAFKSWNGQSKDCLVQVWRQWPDGCTHYQWFDKCNNKWDVDQKGQNRVFWTCCVH